MIVTCDNCGARYKLDDSRISGRGAKITCPRCRHVFVVYKDRPAGGAAPAAAPEVTERALTTHPPDAAPSNQRDVDSLDFRKVGIQSWKVKVKIGLVYDFSDYKTLSKYISDGRVTSTDLLSHDGTEWTPIGDISDLKQHFVDVYCAAEAALGRGEEAAQNDVGDFDDDDAPTNIMGMDDLAGNLGAERATQAAGGFSTARRRARRRGQRGGRALQDRQRRGRIARFVDPFEQPRSRGSARRGRTGGGGAAGQRHRSRPHPPASAAAQPSCAQGRRRGGGMLLVAIALLALAGGGYWWKSNQAASTPAAPTATAAPTSAPPKPKASAPPRKISPVESSRRAWVRPSTGDRRRQLGPRRRATAHPRRPARVPERRRPPTPVAPPDTPARRSGLASAPAGGGASGSGGVEYSTMSARDHADAGWASYRRGDYSSAVSSFQQAVSMSPGNGEYNGKLGASLLRAGDLAGAQGPLRRPRRGLRSRTRLPRRPLRPAGRQRRRRQPLPSPPRDRSRDATRVQAKIDRLSGT